MLPSLKTKIRQCHKELKLTESDLKKIDELKDINKIVGKTLLLGRIVDYPKPSELLEELLMDLIKAGAKISMGEFFNIDIDSVSVRRSTGNSNILVCQKKVQGKKIELIRAPVEDIFSEAIELKSIPWIEFLIDGEYIPYPPTLNMPQPFQSGFWVRHFSEAEIKSEINNINTRATLSKDLLRGHGDSHPTVKMKKTTHYSPATFIVPGYKILLYNNPSENTGIIMLPKKDRIIDYWYSGLDGEELTRDVDYNAKVLKAYQKEDGHHFRNISEQRILSEYPNCVKTVQAFQHKQLDKYGAIIASCPDLGWNEGLFRYQSNDISGIFVNPKNAKSIDAAFELRKALTKEKAFELTADHLPYYFYNEDDGSLQQIRPLELKEQLKKLLSHQNQPQQKQNQESVVDLLAKHRLLKQSQSKITSHSLENKTTKKKKTSSSSVHINKGPS